MEMDQNAETGRTCSELPEGCIANMLALTTPEDSCRLSMVSKGFHSAADSDGVWEKFLPPDYLGIIARSINPSSLPQFSSTKNLYLHLSDHPLIIDGGGKSFSLEKRSGKKCYMLAARTLKIVWAEADTPQYWTWTSLPDARFEEVAELHIVWWLEIRGNINTSLLSPNTNYAAYLVYKLLPNARGFKFPNKYHNHQSLPAEVYVGLFGEEGDTHYVSLDPEREAFSSSPKKKEAIFVSIRYPNQRKDGWLEVELGEFFNKRGENEEVEMSLMEVKAPITKRGLIVAGIEIRPKEVGQLIKNVEVMTLCFWDEEE